VKTEMTPRAIHTIVLVLALTAAGCAGTGGDETTPENTTAVQPAPDTTVDAGGSDATGAVETTGAGGSSLIVYSGRSEELVAPVIEAFETETGTDVEVRYAGSGELATTLLQEGDSSPADVFWAQDPAFAGAVAEAGLFSPLPPEVIARVPERFSDADGRWVGVTGRARVMVYNPDLMAEDELPADVWSLTDPAWRGRLGIAPTNGSFVAFVAAMALVEGEERTTEWLEAIAENDPVIYDGNAPIVAAVDAGDIAAGLVNH
jgi:iron(III) transport system substrate-binding protein